MLFLAHVVIRDKNAWELSYENIPLLINEVVNRKSPDLTVFSRGAESDHEYHPQLLLRVYNHCLNEEQRKSTANI